MTDPGLVPAVLALELAAPVPDAARMLPTEAAALLVDQVAADLVRLVPDVHELGLSFGASLLDPAQVLRPHWPVYDALARLYRAERRARDAAQLIGHGAAGGRMADAALEPELALGSGTLLLMPWLLVGEPVRARSAAVALDEVLEEQGLAGAGVALALRQALGIELAHARYFTHHDVCALTAIQLEHAGLAAAWPMLEAALFAPAERSDARAASGQPWRYAGGGRIEAGAAGYRAWLATFAGDVPTTRIGAAFAAWQLEQRRTAALLQAHALPVHWVALGDSDRVLPEQVLLERLGPPSARAHIVAHVDAELGVVALSAHASGVAFARAYPLGSSLEPALRALAAHSCCDARIDARTEIAADPSDPSQLSLG